MVSCRIDRPVFDTFLPPPGGVTPGERRKDERNARMIACNKIAGRIYKLLSFRPTPAENYPAKKEPTDIQSAPHVLIYLTDEYFSKMPLR